MEYLGAMAYSRYTGFREITDRDVLELHCINWDLQEYCFHRLVNAMLKVGLLFLFANLGHIGI